MNKRVLITGGAGFQGSNLAKRLLDKEYEVVVLNTWSKRSENIIEKMNLQKAKIVFGSITDKNLVEKTIRDVDLVVHCAANIHVDDSINNPQKYYEVNVLGTNNILEECRKKNISLLHISSCEVYGGQEHCLTEESPFKPNSPYASSKAGADVEVYSYCKTFGVDATILRPSNVFGIGQKCDKRGAVIAIWVNKLLSGENIQIYGIGDQSREFIYIEDLIDVYEKIIERKLKKKNTYAGEIFNVGTNQRITINNLAMIIMNNIPKVGKIEYVSERPGEVKQFILDSSKIMKTLKWKPKISIEEGIQRYVEWVIKNEN